MQLEQEVPIWRAWYAYMLAAHRRGLQVTAEEIMTARQIYYTAAWDLNCLAEILDEDDHFWGPIDIGDVDLTVPPQPGSLSSRYHAASTAYAIWEEKWVWGDAFPVREPEWLSDEWDWYW